MAFGSGYFSFIFFHFLFAKIKSNIMRITTENGRRTARGTTRGSPLPLVSTQSGEPGDAVDRAGVGLQRRIAFAATPSPSRVYDEPKKPDNPRGCQLRVSPSLPFIDPTFHEPTLNWQPRVYDEPKKP